MACGEITVCGGLRARLFRISFSGELAFEIAVPTGYGDALMREIIAMGQEYDITPYGTEALGVEVVSAHFVDPDGERLRA